MAQGRIGLGIMAISDLLGSTCMERVLAYHFDVASMNFRIKEVQLTGQYLDENPLPYFH